ncbi:hypothetical protein L228DRAFT_265946 [Xylona heveae TC161]|uniref:AN1-type domain-containing protein n=1 Tax=Xylona heveae (strain CBS 132557 / TC161) TaxID=1328760 RepID=A0A165IWL7_XYLHT|nr:hypothetical protein L228DRAFT_265946 [Xylona heveae TC161]KZF25478.1 hypothetical protein L228DRAFT_265946 [Xylona heveae TC161]
MASPSVSGATEPQSYTTMEKGDVDAIGAHCKYQYCNQLDFLPFRCESCRDTFCLDHRTETAHKCRNAGAWAAARREKNLGASISSSSPSPSPSPVHAKCAHPECKTKIDNIRNPGVQCTNCNRQYCLKHRLREEHDCSNLIPLGARPARFDAQAQKEKALSAFAKFSAAMKEKRKTVLPKKPSSNAARIVELNKLKKDAKGDQKIPSEKRVYLHIEGEKETTTSKFPAGKFFYNKEWSVGRMLDEAAKGLQVQNVNNRGGGEEEKLRVYHVEGGRLLEFSEKLGEAFVSGNTAVLLRGVGPAVPDLIEI